MLRFNRTKALSAALGGGIAAIAFTVLYFVLPFVLPHRAAPMATPHPHPVVEATPAPEEPMPSEAPVVAFEEPPSARDLAINGYDWAIMAADEKARLARRCLAWHFDEQNAAYRRLNGAGRQRFMDDYMQKSGIVRQVTRRYDDSQVRMETTVDALLVALTGRAHE